MPKRALRDALIRASHRSGVAGLRQSLLRRRQGTLYRVLCFHRVLDGAAFRHKIRLVKEHYGFVALDDVGREGGSHDVRVAVTFDDGYPEQFEVAAPILREEGVPATFFVVSGSVGLEGDEASRFYGERVGIAHDQAPSAELLAATARDPLFEIGSHSRTHMDLGLAWSHDELLEELVSAKRELEEVTGTPVVRFAYPFGGVANVAAAVPRVVEEAGYVSAFTISPGFNAAHTGRFRLHRDSLEPELDDGLFLAWLAGGYDQIKSMADGVRTRIGRKPGGYRT